jgi:hypothetical protein
MLKRASILFMLVINVTTAALNTQLRGKSSVVDSVEQQIIERNFIFISRELQARTDTELQSGRHATPAPRGQG